MLTGVRPLSEKQHMHVGEPDNETTAMVLYSDNAEAVEWINMCWRKVRRGAISTPDKGSVQRELAHPALQQMCLQRCSPSRAELQIVGSLLNPCSG
jgi:hypothetical protein